jgi:DNA processing protein
MDGIDDDRLDRWAWVALALVREVGWNARRYHDLLAIAPPSALFRSPRRVLGAEAGTEVASAIAGFDWVEAGTRQAALAERAGAKLLTLEDADYPAALRGIPLPPPFLFVRGSLHREDGLAIAVVGSRRPTSYGVRMAGQLAADLAERGVAVVSGFARGVDTAAHRGALQAGRTVAVLGSGVDVLYPPENRGLADRILGDAKRGAAGAIVSQFPMGTAPLPQHFPLRNRVIAALSIGTVVVEAAEKSGALITVRCAAELGREVYAVPGNVSSPTSQGTNRLIQDGAKLVGDWRDVVAEWPPAWRGALRPAAEAAGLEGRVAAVQGDARETQILSLLGDDPLAIDLVIERSGLSSGQVAAGLTTLELRGLVRQLAGQRYVRR